MRPRPFDQCAQGWGTLAVGRIQSTSQSKVIECATDHPDRDQQFRWIADRAADFQAANQSVIAVDAKKKELVGDFKNGGRGLQPHEQREIVQVYDFPSLATGKATPYGIYDVTRNEGRVNVGQRS